jgi:hypothetical protein
MAAKKPINQILKITLERSDLKRVEQRTTIRTVVHGEKHQLADMGRGAARPAAADPAQVAAMTEEERQACFARDFDFVTSVFPEQALGFDLDPLMEALYGPVVAGGASKKRKKRGKAETASDAGGDEEQQAIPEEMVLPDVVYNKRLKPTAEFMGLPPNVITPQTTDQRVKLDMQGDGLQELDEVAALAVGGSGDGGEPEEEDVRKREAAKEANKLLRRRQRRLAGRTRILPVVFLPYFLLTQRSSIVQMNSVFIICFDLLRNMERNVVAYAQDKLYCYTMLQFRVNLDRILAHVQARFMAGQAVLQESTQLAQDIARQRLQVSRVSKTLGHIIDFETKTEQEFEAAAFNGLVKPLVAPVEARLQELVEGFAAKAVERQLKQGVDRMVKEITDRVVAKLNQQTPLGPLLVAPKTAATSTRPHPHRTATVLEAAVPSTPLSASSASGGPSLKRQRSESDGTATAAAPSPFAAIFGSTPAAPATPKTPSAKSEERAAKRARTDDKVVASTPESVGVNSLFSLLFKASSDTSKSPSPPQ